MEGEAAMNRRILIPFAVVALAALSGCFSFGSKKVAKLWTVDCPGHPILTVGPRVNEATPPKTVRIGSVSVAAPWDCDNIVVRRADGSVARDPYNKFAAQPAALLKGPLMALAASEGVFGRVMPGATAASPDAILELTVTDLSLDCSGNGRKASVALSAALVSGAGRKVIADGSGDARADASSGDYTAAFSEAFSSALKSAFSKMK